VRILKSSDYLDRHNYLCLVEKLSTKLEILNFQLAASILKIFIANKLQPKIDKFI